jgi:Domain of unknown function (DUF4192)
VDHTHPEGPDHQNPDHDGEPDQPRPLLRLRAASHLLTAVPYLLGYQPAEPSLVVVGMREREVVLTAATAELPAAGDLPAAWAAFSRALVANDADAVVVIAYADRDWTTTLQRFADTAPLPVVDLLRVHERRWWSLSCPDPSACIRPECGPTGAKLIEHPQVAAPLIAGGAAAPGTRQELAAALQPGPEALLTAVTAVLAASPRRDHRALYAALREARDARTDRPEPLPPRLAAVLLQAVADPRVRDACLAWTDDAAWWLWHDLIHAAPPGWVAPTATLIAAAAYQRGNSAITSIALERALADVPGYPLAQFLRASLDTAVRPEAIRALIAEALADHPLHDRADDTSRPGHDQAG